MKSPPRSTLVWSAATLAAGGLLALIQLGGNSTLRELAAERVAAEKVLHVPPLPAVSAGTPLLDSALIRDRALFYSARAWVPPPAPPAPVPAYQVASLLILPDGKSVAIVKSASQPASVKLHVHDGLEGWTVEEISMAHVVLSNQNQRAELFPMARSTHVAAAPFPNAVPTPVPANPSPPTPSGSLAVGGIIGARLPSPY